MVRDKREIQIQATVTVKLLFTSTVYSTLEGVPLLDKVYHRIIWKGNMEFLPARVSTILMKTSFQAIFCFST